MVGMDIWGEGVGGGRGGKISQSGITAVMLITYNRHWRGMSKSAGLNIKL